MTLVDQGVDLGVKGLTAEGLSATEAMLGFAQEHGLARLTMDAGYGFETVWEPVPVTVKVGEVLRSEEHTSELQSLMRISYAVFCLKKKNKRGRAYYDTKDTYKHTRRRKPLQIVDKTTT